MNIIPLQFANARSTATAPAAFAANRSTFVSTDVLTGIAIVAIVPAVFWTSLIWGASYVFDLGFSTTTLAVMAAAIAGFLSIVCSAVIAAD
ncbi:MAG: hypothetical protein ABL901_17385 [Hyphomicrobiaceae bacterium]